jgi:hypothetical protein
MVRKPDQHRQADTATGLAQHSARDNEDSGTYYRADYQQD